VKGGRETGRIIKGKAVDTEAQCKRAGALQDVVAKKDTNLE
jgi:hypothetical protein